MNKIVKKTLKLVIIVLISIATLLLALYGVLWIVRAVMYRECIKVRTVECDIPGLGSGYVPQGVCYCDEDDMYILTGYSGKSNTVAYTVKDGKATKLSLADGEGNALKGHGGGVACTKDFVYISEGKKLIIYSLDAIKNFNGEAIKPIGVKPVDNSASYCFSDGSRIFVGEFYRAGNYETDENHYYTTPSGEVNKAIVSCYKLNADGSIAGDYPEYSISVTGLVQGFATIGDSFILSRSYGLTNSKLDYYTGVTDTGKNITLDFPADESLGTKEVPLYCLDPADKVKELVLPSFSEDLDIITDENGDSRVIVNTEAACNKYIVGKFFGATKVYAFPVPFKSE